MSIPDLQFNFDHQYNVQVSENLPGNSEKTRQLYFPGAGDHGKNGLVVKFTPNKGAIWFGVFAFGYDSINTITGVFSHPNELFACIISSGSGYMVQVDNPIIWEGILAFPIVAIFPIYEKNLLVFVDYTKIVAYDHQGLAWTTQRLSWDGLEITEVTDQFIKGFAWNAPQDRQTPFTISTSTGNSQ